MDKALRDQHKTLVRNYNAAMSALADAQNQMVEEISAEGFGSKKTKNEVRHYQAEVDDADFDLYVFEQENKAFMEKLKAERAKDAELAFERLWNQ